MNKQALFKEFASLPNLYEYMGVKEEADGLTLRKAFKALTFKFHPDLNPEPDAAQKFITLKRANEVLESEETRKAYDEFLEDKKQAKASKEAISEKRQYFVDLLRKREEEARQAHRAAQDDVEIVNDYLKKKRMSKNVERIYEAVGQKEVNEILEGQRKNREELRRMLSTIKVKILDREAKSYTSVLLKMIFRRFGPIADISFDSEQHKCFVQFNDISSAESAKNHFEDSSDFRIKHLITENRDKCLDKLTDLTSGFDLNSQNIHKIAATYNGYSYDQRKRQLDREVERQRAMRDMMEEIL